MTRPFLIDREGNVLSYEALLSSWESGSVSFSRSQLSGGFRATLLEVAKAIVFDQPITLYDADLVSLELQRIGSSPACLSETELLPPLRRGGSENRFESIQSSRKKSRCRITLFTSGSSGRPKRVSHELINLSRGVRVAPRHAVDIWAFAYNPTHMAGLQVFLQAFFNLNPLVDLFRLSAKEVRQRLREHKVTHISATPTFYRLLLENLAPISSVKSVTLGGERADANLLEQLRKLFPNARIRNIYASTEGGSLLIAEGEFFKISTEGEKDVRVTAGHLQVHRRLLGVFEGAPEFSTDWYDTGDVVETCREDPSKFKIIGREQEWINIGGNKVDPAEVESVLLEHPSVLAVRVYGKKNSITGELVCAEVMSRGPVFDESVLLEYATRRLQSFKIPRILKRVDVIEQTRTGKVKRYH